MRKLILFMMTSLDGYYAGPNDELDWHNVDAEFNDFAIDQLDSVDMILFGRVTYQGMASYWPTPMAAADDPIVAGKMNQKDKLVFSHTLDKADWQNTRLVTGDIPAEINRLKNQPGKDLIIFGSGDLGTAFIQMGLLDELRIMVNPVVLGAGKSLFKGLLERISLNLVRTQTFVSGNVLLVYHLKK